MRARLPTLISLTALACACSGPQPAPPPPPPAAPAVSFDGQYKGSIRITKSHSNWCDTSPAVSLSVQRNAFAWTLVRSNLPQGELYNPTFEVSIGPDGAFTVQGGNDELTSLTGRIVGTHMSGAIDGKYCGYVFSAERA
jgi:hypothetical protein